MKKIAMLGLFVVLTTGCGRGWLPLFRGAPCRSNCLAPAMPAAYDAGCTNCAPGAAAGYGTYEGEVYEGASGYYNGGVIGSGLLENGYNEGTIINPTPRTPITPAT